MLVQLYYEEMGSEAGTRVGRLLWIIENNFTLEGTPQHEVGFYYQFSCTPGNSWHDRGRIHIGREEQMKLFFKWFSLETLDDLPLPLYPSVLRQALHRLPDIPVHIIHRDT